MTRDLTQQHAFEASRESFFRGITHDLKAPLAAILGFAQILAGAPGEQQRRLAADRLKTNVQHLTGMVDDLAEHARLRAGSAPLHLERLELVAVLRETVADLHPILHRHDVVVEGAAHEVDADQGLVQRMLINLLANAAKYSPPGSTIRATVTSGDDRVRLDIADQGRGIERHDLPLIFDEFERGSLAESDGGAGLGLASVKQVVNLLEGEVWIDSEVGVGTVVTVDLPHAMTSRNAEDSSHR